MNERARAAAAADGSLGLEGLAPSAEVQRLSDAWVRGEVSTDQLVEAERRLLAGESLAALVPAEAPPAPRAA